MKRYSNRYLHTFLFPIPFQNIVECQRSTSQQNNSTTWQGLQLQIRAVWQGLLFVFWVCIKLFLERNDVM